MKATEQQQDAITSEGRALLVEAGAGTGKTSVLVQRFIHLLSVHPDWPLDSIVAITFTEKATREMRTRIRREIEARALAPQQGTGSVNHTASEVPDLPKSRPAVALGTGTTGACEAGVDWHAHRRNLDRLQVSTIHGLCARILRENAIAAGVDPCFTVLDEQAAAVLKEEAIRQALAALTEEDDPALALLAGFHVGDLQSELAALLDKRGSVDRTFADLPAPETLLAMWRAGVAERQQAEWQGLVQEEPRLSAALAYLPLVPISDPDDKLAEAVRLAQQGCRCLSAGDDVAGALTAFAAINRSGGRMANWGGSKDALDELKAMLGAVQEAGKQLDRRGVTQPVGPQDEAAAAALQWWRDLWEQTTATYDRLKAASQALDFDDLERLAEQLLYREPRGERLLAYLVSIRHLMVDEYQDTNAVQQRIIYALADPADGGRLFAVGDAKQSIYRFRQAQVGVFYRTARDIKQYSGRGPVPLNRSFRTHAGLVAAFNCAFDAILRPLGDTYADYEARPGPLDYERAAPPAAAGEPAPVEMWLLSQEMSAEEARLAEARQLADRLLKLQADHCAVWDRRQGCYRPFQFSDAAVLFRATSDFPLYEEQFKLAGLPYLTVSGHGYYDLPEVRDLVALLACLYARGDDLSLATALRSPLFGLSDETLYRLRRHSADGSQAERPVPLALALAAPAPTAQPGAVAFAAETMHALWGMAGRVDIWKLLRTACDRTGYEASMALFDRSHGGRRSNNVAKFLELARRHGSASLSAFLRQLQDLQAREAREGEALGSAPPAGAVQLMSVHAAKGLEFPVVAVADLGRATNHHNSTRILHDPVFGIVCQQRDADGQWQKPAGYRWAEWLNGRMEAAESKRVLYVACTRAADLLLLSGRPGVQDSWLASLTAAWQMPVDGPDEEILDRPGFALRVVRTPATATDHVEKEIEPPTHPGLSELPPRVQPLPVHARQRLLAASRLQEQLAVETGDLPEIRPVVRGPDGSGEAGLDRAPVHVIGRIVHRSLIDWDCLALPGEALAARLENWGREEGLATPAALQHATGRAGRMLAGLRRSGFYRELAAAGRRFTGIPFTLGMPGGIVNGTIDMLYEDVQGWHLVDWRTDWVAAGQREAQAGTHYPRLAVLGMAAERALGRAPQVLICFLGGDVAIHPCPADRLAAAWQQLIDNTSKPRLLL